MFEDSMGDHGHGQRERERGEHALGAASIVGWLLFALLVIALLAAHASRLWPFQPRGVRDAQRAERATGLGAAAAADLVRQFRISGLLLREDGSRYWVSLDLWARLDAQAKERVCLTLYTWRMAQGSELPVQIFDSKSGRALAGYSTWSGFHAE